LRKQESFTAKPAKAAEEEKSLTAKAAKTAEEEEQLYREGH